MPCGHLAQATKCGQVTKYDHIRNMGKQAKRDTGRPVQSLAMCLFKGAHIKKEELFDLAIAPTRGQDLRIDTLERNGANAMLHGIMGTLQHGKCLVKIPVRSVEIVRIQDHLQE